MSRRLLLDREPESVRHARRWVVQTLQELGRDDLVDSAALGVSELVTNAMLHADPPITVTVGGTVQHPRVQVHDSSTRPPRISHEMTEDDQLLRTVGRGLGIVASYSHTWGAEVSPEGKMVWFEPVVEPDPESQPEGSVFDLSGVVGTVPQAALPDPGSLIRIQLLGMPAQLFAEFRRWYADMRRELRILSLAHARDYPIAAELTELTHQVELERTQATGIDELNGAIEAGLERVDLDYLVPPSAPGTMREFGDLLDRVDDFCREHRLLSMPAGPQQVELRHWYVGEFVRQADGGDPMPWAGAYVAEPALP